ncbi:MAG TPA: nucleotide exchange factor GrpE [Candidatus Paceibacterota bacterium]
MADEENNLPEPTVADLKEQIEEMTVQRDEYLAGWQRSKADFINYKKEEMKKMEDITRYGSEGLIKDLISVMDNFDLALRTLEKAGPVEKGIYLIRTQIEDILKKRGLEKIDLKPGDAFDPAIAEALSSVESEQPPGAIAQEIEPGYRLHEKVLRPARVIVSKDKSH